MVKQLLLLAEKWKYILQNLGCSKSSRVFMLREHTSKQILPFKMQFYLFQIKAIFYMYLQTRVLFKLFRNNSVHFVVNFIRNSCVRFPKHLFLEIFYN